MRVISLLASGTEIVCQLGAADALVGRSHECDNPEWVRKLPACTRPAFDVNLPSGKIDAEVRRRVKAGEPLYHIDADLIRDLRPDLLITQEHCEVCAVTPEDVARGGGGICASQVLALSAGSVDGIFEGITSIARSLDRVAAGQSLISEMRSRMNAVTAAVRNKATPTVVTLEWIVPIFSMGNWGPELVEAANGRVLLGEKGQYSKAIAWDQVRAADPDFLIVAPCGFGLERTRREAPMLEELPGWKQLKSVRAGNVVLADGNLYFNRSGTTIVETVEIIAQILHGYRPTPEALANGWEFWPRSNPPESTHRRHPKLDSAPLHR
jgi:iron complex transport system substrate-binding protein